jgi:UDPglucose--hexose-1-phosphate uridylyltransferase
MPSSPELRQDPFTRNWVVIAPERSRRPDSFRNEVRQQKAGARCPLCPGYETETPPEIWRLNDSAGNWRVRVVPNKFAAFVGDGEAQPEINRAGFVSMPSIGRHEVVIETPDHSADLPDLPVGGVRDVLEAYRARYRALLKTRPALILIFRNHGVGAGTSLAHPHSQIVAIPVVPLDSRRRIDVAIQHYEETGVNLYLDVLEHEMREGSRIVHMTQRFVAFQPFASIAPFETWIMPRFEGSAFGDASDADLNAFASILRTVLGGLRCALNDPDYNYVIVSVPPGDENRGYFVWHLRIVPRVTTPAGFELGSGMPVNPSWPEETAAILRQVIADDLGASATDERDDLAIRSGPRYCGHAGQLHS